MCFVIYAVEGKNKGSHSDFLTESFRFFFPRRVAGLQKGEGHLMSQFDITSSGGIKLRLIFFNLCIFNNVE